MNFQSKKFHSSANSCEVDLAHSAMPLNTELTDLLDDYLSQEKLISLTGVTDLNCVKFLEIQVDSRSIGLGQLGKFVPNIEQLKLNNSHVECIRDLGTGFTNLRVLWMPRCELAFIDGIGSLRSLKELYLAYNRITDISSIGMLEELEILDLESNLISDLEQIEHLAVCPNLEELSLQGNPLDLFQKVLNKNMDDPKEKFIDTIQAYREIIGKTIPQLKILDDYSIGELHVQYETNFNINTEYPSALFKACSNALEKSGDKPHGVPIRPATAQSRFGSIHSKVIVSDTGSNLTHGISTVLTGNPIMLLRARRKDRPRSTSTSNYSAAFEDASFTVDHPSSPSTSCTECVEKRIPLVGMNIVELPTLSNSENKNATLLNSQMPTANLLLSATSNTLSQIVFTEKTELNSKCPNGTNAGTASVPTPPTSAPKHQIDIGRSRRRINISSVTAKYRQQEDVGVTLVDDLRPPLNRYHIY
ncbi:hypothetical protein BDV3_001687 [Batrachochytrium dendrobatidis]